MPQLIAPPSLPRTGAAAGGEPRVLWRTWRLVPEWMGRSEPEPLLTGSLGFPWRAATLDAKCLNQLRRPGGLVDRHHRVVPDPACSCGIYAAAAELTTPSPGSRTHPTVIGFVALSGRVLAAPTTLRAQRAEIVGPLSLSVPPRSRFTGRRHRTAAPQRVIVERDRYRILWTTGRTGVPFGEWRAAVAARLSDRYGVDVVIGDASR